MRDREELILHAKIFGATISATYTHVAMKRGDQVETHPLTGCSADIVTNGGITSHKTFTRGATGALVGGVVPGISALTGAVLAPHKKIDNRTARIVVSGPGFHWSEPVRPDSLPYRSVADFNDRAAKYTADPAGVEAWIAHVREAEAERQAAKDQQRADKAAAKQDARDEAVAICAARDAETARARQDAAVAATNADVERLTGLETKAAALRAEGKTVRADVAWGEAVKLRAKLAARVGDQGLPSVVDGGRQLSWAEQQDVGDLERIARLEAKAAEQRAAGKDRKADTTLEIAQRMRDVMAKRHVKQAARP